MTNNVELVPVKLISNRQDFLDIVNRVVVNTFRTVT